MSAARGVGCGVRYRISHILIDWNEEDQRAYEQEIDDAQAPFAAHAVASGPKRESAEETRARAAKALRATVEVSGRDVLAGTPPPEHNPSASLDATIALIKGGGYIEPSHRYSTLRASPQRNATQRFL